MATKIMLLAVINALLYLEFFSLKSEKPTKQIADEMATPAIILY